jgi:phage repressor protein C with HTH and peptisase S24 domain
MYSHRMTIGDRLDAAMRKAGFKTQKALELVSGIPQPTISRILSNSGSNGPETETLRALATACGVTFESLLEDVGTSDAEPPQTGKSSRRRLADFDLVSADDTDGETGKIEYWDARGSCGGGFLNYDQLPKGHLVKEATFFHKFNVKPGDLFAIYADGDSMADFIVDGDIVIFNKKISAPRSGKIYAIDHPDGLKIKVLRRSIDGSWTLESKNADKRAFPDEHIPVDQVDLLKVHGEFVYRQGG